MKNLETTQMSSTGHVVIPENIRKRLKLKAGSRFVVAGKNDVIILKTVEAPSMQAYNGLIKEVRQKAKKTDLKRGDISEAVSKARRRSK